MIHLYENKRELIFILGKIVQDQFNIACFFKLERSKNDYFNRLYTKLLVEKFIYVEDSHRNLGLAKFMYEYMINNLNYRIMSDNVHFFGARKLWSKLSKLLDYSVDLVDIKNNEIIKKDIEVNHGMKDSDIDEEIYSYENADKENVRLILNKKI